MINSISLQDIPQEVSILAKWEIDDSGYIRTKGISYQNQLLKRFLKLSPMGLLVCYISVID
jgi:hypothetical protein